MGRAEVSREYQGTVHQAESAWYDAAGWPEWVDGVEQVEEIGAGWPGEGSHVRWRSGPAGRGEVIEQVVAYEPLGGQTVQVVDAQMEAQQSVSFAPIDEDHVRVSLTLDYRIRRRNPLTPLVDRIFIRSAVRASLDETLARFGRRLDPARQ